MSDLNEALEEAENEKVSNDISNLSYDDETILWEGRPSQWVNFGSFIFWILILLGTLIFQVFWSAGLNQGYSPLVDQAVFWMSIAVIGFALLNMVVPFLHTYFEYTVITKNKIKEAKGITSVFRSEKFCEISDIKDINSPPAGLLALFGLSTLVIETNDDDQPIINIRAIRNREELINKLLPIWRELKIERKGYFGDK